MYTCLCYCTTAVRPGLAHRRVAMSCLSCAIRSCRGGPVRRRRDHGQAPLSGPHFSCGPMSCWLPCCSRSMSHSRACKVGCLQPLMLAYCLHARQTWPEGSGLNLTCNHSTSHAGKPQCSLWATHGGLPALTYSTDVYVLGLANSHTCKPHDQNIRDYVCQHALLLWHAHILYQEMVTSLFMYCTSSASATRNTPTECTHVSKLAAGDSPSQQSNSHICILKQGVPSTVNAMSTVEPHAL